VLTRLQPIYSAETSEFWDGLVAGTKFRTFSYRSGFNDRGSSET
jgi:hypothetical protein